MSRTSPKKITLFFYCLVLTCISGCWNLVEIDKRAFITALGIDRIPGGRVELSVQVPMPMRMLPPSVAGGSSEGKRFTVLRFKDETVNAAFNDLQTKTFHEVVIEQNKAIIIGEKTARAGLKPLIEFLVRDPKSPPQALVLVVKNHSAREVVSLAPIQEILPGLQFYQSSHTMVKFDRTYYVALWDFLRRAVHRSTDTFAPLIDYDPNEKRYIVAGVGIFDGYRLAEKLDMDETQCFGILTGLMRSGGLTLKLRDIGTITLQNVHSKSRIKVLSNSNGIPFFRIEIRLFGGMNEMLVNHQEIFFKELTPQYSRRLESAAQGVLKKQLSEVVRKIQRSRADVLDFGEQLRIQHPEIWRRLNWKKVYPDVSYQIVIKVKIGRDGVFQ